MSTTITALAAECASLATDPIPAREAWAALAATIRGVPMVKLTKMRVGWSRTHYADHNALGTSGYEYDSRIRGIVVGDQGSGIERAGGQNGGHYVLGDSDCLFFSTDGRVYEVVAVEGHWSNWQGSSSSYSLTWREYQGDITDECLEAVVADVVSRLTALRDDLRRRKVAGARMASRILSALESVGCR